MNRTRTSKNAKRLLVWLLTLTMVFGLLPMAAFADEAVVEPVQETEPSSEPTEAPSEPTQEPETISELEQPGNADVTIEGDEEQPEDEDMLETASLTATDYVAPPAYTIDPSNPIRVYHIDCGRKYFSATQINAIIDKLAEYGYTHIELAFGNEGLRFLLDDMSVNANGTTYDGSTIKSAIKSFNASFDNSSENLSETDMNSIFSHAAEKKIKIIPLLNSPGHMDAILSAMEAVGIENVKYKNSARTVDITNVEAVNFTMALVEKYVKYFAGKDCQFFNIGTDEYANDVTSGFADLITARKYGDFVTYVNNLDNIVKSHGMLTIAFNDGIYYNNTTNDGTFYNDIIISYWTSGWSGYSPASPDFLINRGHKILNTNDAWYYVLGRRSGNYPLSNAQNGVNKKAYNVLTNGSTINGNSLVGCMMCLWCDDPKASYNDSELNTISDLLSTFAQKNSTVFKTTTPGGGESGGGSTGGGETGDVDLTVSIGETVTYKANGDVTDSFIAPADGEATAKVGVEFTTTPGKTEKSRGSVIDVTQSTTSTGVISDGNGHYLMIDSNGNTTNTTEFSKATQFTVTKNTDNTYNIKGGDYYLSVARTSYMFWYDYSLSTSKNAVKWTYTSSKGFVHDGYGYGLNYSDEWTVSSSGGNGKLYGIKTATTASTSETVLSITGVTVGDTTCKFDNKVYKIHVVDKAPDGAMTSDSLTLEYWITNYPVYDGTSTSTNHTRTITSSTDGAASDEGIEIAKIAPSPAYSFFDGTVTVYYWQAMRLDADNQQTSDSGDDETSDGTTLTHVRYYGGAWQYKTADGTWHYFLSSDQLVAYYLQKTEVTKEVTSFVKDWGYGTGSTTSDTSSGKGQVALTVAVVYPDGTVSPAEGQMYANSTTIFNYWDGRDIGIVAPTNNSEYTISKITVTDGTRDRNSSANVWYTSDSITWEKTTNAAGSTWYDETEVWNESSGTTPMVNGKTSKITWSAKNTAKLVLIYLKPVEKETNLTVKYINLSANNAVFHQYQVAMKYAGEATPTFTDELRYNGTVIGGNSPWDSNDPKSSDYLPDEAYVINSSNVEQKFKKDITTIPEISGLYASGLYEYVKADITDEGKTLNLYYKLKPSTDKTYVVDFGLPIVIPFADFNVTNLDGSTKASFDEKTEKLERTGNYGKGTINMTERNVTYSLFKMLDALTPIPVYFKDTKGNVLMRSVNVIPASNVYYEDSFATLGDGKGAASDAVWTPSVVATEKQALSELGSDKNVYGYDEAYKNSTTYSMGSAAHVTVTKAMADAWTDGSAWPTATFTFKGTGFDIISLTSNKSGVIAVDVVGKEEASGNEVEKNLMVSNYYGYTYNETTQKWEVVDTNSETALYQIPVMKVDDLEYGTYTVTIKPFYYAGFDVQGTETNDFYLDAIRIYNPLGKNYADYVKDGEGYPQYIKLRDKVADGKATTNNKLLFIDGADQADVALYANYGPNNEVYLAKGQAISFKLPANTNIATVQIGAKSPNADDTSKALMNVSINETAGEPEKIGTATEMYYKISDNGNSTQQVTITNTGDAILSLTNLKITYANKSETSLETLSTNDAEMAVATVCALFAEPAQPGEPEKTFDPERFDWEWSKNVRKGGRAILTVKASTDVDYIVVDGEKYDKFITRTERTGWGRNAQRVTYREFVYMTTINDSGLVEIPVKAVNADGVESEPVATTLNVKASSPIRDWIGGLLGRWF